MKRMTIVGAFVLLFAMVAGPALADLPDTGTKGDLEGACEELGGEFEASGWGTSGDPTCVVETEEELIQDNPGVVIKSEGGETVYTHSDTTTERNLVTGGAWDDGVTTGGGEVCITVKKTGKQICPAGFNN